MYWIKPFSKWSKRSSPTLSKLWVLQGTVTLPHLKFSSQRPTPRPTNLRDVFLLIDDLCLAERKCSRCRRKSSRCSVQPANDEANGVYFQQRARLLQHQKKKKQQQVTIHVCLYFDYLYCCLFTNEIVLLLRKTMLALEV